MLRTLRAKGTLISEPRFSTPCEMRFFPREKGEMAFVEGFSLKIRKILVSVKFVSAILGPEMAAPILWTPGKMRFFLQENTCP